MSGPKSRGGRPRKTLAQLVELGTFRMSRHERLLGGALLPKEAPFEDKRRRGVWSELREQQISYKTSAKEAAELAGDEEIPREGLFSVAWCRKLHAQGFAALARVLHGGRRPWWLGTDMDLDEGEHQRGLERVLRDL